MLYVCWSSANLDAEAARTKFVEHKEELENELDKHLRLFEKLELELAAKRELRNLVRQGTNSEILLISSVLVVTK